MSVCLPLDFMLEPLETDWQARDSLLSYLKLETVVSRSKKIGFFFSGLIGASGVGNWETSVGITIYRFFFVKNKKDSKKNRCYCCYQFTYTLLVRGSTGKLRMVSLPIICSEVVRTRCRYRCDTFLKNHWNRKQSLTSCKHTIMFEFSLVTEFEPL